MCICYLLVMTSCSEVPFVWEHASSVTMCYVGECGMVHMGERGMVQVYLIITIVCTHAQE